MTHKARLFALRNKRIIAGAWLFGIWAICHLLVVAISPPIWQGIIAGYPGDSFWTLSSFGRFGVIAISLCGMISITMVNTWKTRRILAWSQRRWRLPVWICDVVLSLLAFAVMFSISPQVFYSFYQFIIPGLPAQWVIDGPLNVERLADIAFPRMGASLADHLGAIAIGGIVCFTTYLHWR